MPELVPEISVNDVLSLDGEPRGRNRWDVLVARLEPGRPREILLEKAETLRGVKAQLSSAARRQRVRMRYQEKDSRLYAMKEAPER